MEVLEPGWEQHERTRRAGTARTAWFVVGLSLCACSASVSTEPNAAGGDGLTRRDNEIVHEECDVSASSARRTDVNGDGKADITVVVDGGREVCRAVDLNFDGMIDTFVYNDAQGKIRRRESDYDRDGRIDEISLYKAGMLAQKLRATTQAGKLDTWHFFEGGRLARTERDSDLDTVVDQWWEYPKGARPECPLIHSDVDGDGRPDPGATVDVCGEDSGYVPPERDNAAEPEKKFERSATSGLPTEVQQSDGERGEQSDEASSGDAEQEPAEPAPEGEGTE